jgi:predicted phage terminase large subunit-like protein
MILDLIYTAPQIEVFFPEKPTRFDIVTKGRRFGATKGAANFVIESIIEGKKVLWGDTINSNIDRYVDRYFKPEIIKGGLKFEYSSQKKYLKIYGFDGYCDFRSADRPENWEGFGYDIIFLNEAGIILKNDYLYTNAVLPMLMDYPNSRLIAAGVPKGKYLKNGKIHRFYSLALRAINKEEGFRFLNFSSYDNPLLSRADIKELEEEINRMNPQMVEQEIYGRFVEGAAGVYWDEVILEINRVRELPQLARKIVAIDPAVTSGENSDETGIVLVGQGVDGKYYVIADVSGKYTPTEWATAAIRLYNEHRSNMIIGETNNGGDLIETIIKGIDRSVMYKKVHATKSKGSRAEPVYALYEQGLVKHLNYLPKLESEMLSFDPSNIRSSPNRMDAMVWGILALSQTHVSRPTTSRRKDYNGYYI